jgi:aspartate/methionine/tyrosine aminotransferase
MAESSPTRYAIATIRERVRDLGRSVLDFAVGRGADMAPPGLSPLLARDIEHLLVSGTAAGEHDAFCEAAAAMLRRTYGVDVEPSSVLPAPGGRTAMSFLVVAATAPDDLLLVTEPGYPAMGRIASQLRPSTLTVPLDPRRGFAPDLESVSEDALGRMRFAALNYPNNPTGAVVPHDEIDRFASRFGSRTILFNDATYGPLTFDRPPWSVLASDAARQRRLRFVELHSMAKLYGLGPQPIAFLVGDPDIIAPLRELSEFAWSDQSSLAIRIATTCLADGDHLESVRQLYRDRLARLVAATRALGFDPYPPAGGMYLVCRSPRKVGHQAVSTATEAADLLLRDHELAVIPWDVPPHGYLRFSGRYLNEDLEALLELGRGGPIVAS